MIHQLSFLNVIVVAGQQHCLSGTQKSWECMGLHGDEASIAACHAALYNQLAISD